MVRATSFLPKHMPPSTLTSEKQIDAAAISARLFTPSSTGYLLAAFCLPRFERMATLEHVAEWFGLDEGLRSLNLEADMSRPVEDRWLELLELCIPQLASQSSKRELHALIAALGRMAALADTDRPEATLERLWVEMSGALRVALPKRKGAKYDGAEPATLRGRKWQALRGELAEILARLKVRITPASLLPRAPRRPLMFEPGSFGEIADALDHGSGLVVLNAASGTGRSELALAYANEALEKKRYDRVFVLRATDPLRLEQDFTAMATILAGKPLDRASLRRAAFEYLECNDRWLIVFVAVHDPAFLLQFMPWQHRGHILCTYADANAAKDAPDPWAEYFNIEVATLDAFDAQEFDAEGELARGVPRAVRDGDPFAAFVKAVSGSRHTTALALAWLQYTAPVGDEADLDGYAHRQLERFEEHWNKAGALTRGSTSERVAMVSLLELYDPAPWRAHGDHDVERDAIELLCRLVPFVDRSLNASSFQTVILTKEKYAVAGDRIDDKRVELLERLALANRAVGATVRKYFDVNSAVLRAVEGATRAGWFVDVATEEDAQANAASTMVRILHQPPVKREIPDLTFELLPHITALAQREHKPTAGTPRRRLLAAELYAYSALCHLDRGRTRTAHEQLVQMEKVLKTIVGLPIDATALEDWRGVEDEDRDPVVKRLGKLIRILRMTGFPREATRVFDALVRILDADVPLAKPETQPELARLRFEAAMAYRDIGAMGEALVQHRAAVAIWGTLGTEEAECLLSMAQTFGAELAFDEGRFTDAREKAEMALETRLGRLEAAVRTGAPDVARYRADVGRSLGFIGRIDYVESLIEQARDTLTASVKAWEDAFRDAVLEDPQRCLDRINQIGTRSYLALIEALLGNTPEALAQATTALYDLRAATHRPHAAATIRSNIAQVYRLSGLVGEAVKLHQEAADDAASAWERQHRIARLVRRKQADTLLAAGRPQEALRLLRENLFESPEADVESPGGILRVARTWTSLGRMLVENSFATTDADRTYLDLAQRVFEGARALYHDAAAGQALNPGVVSCLVGLSEIALREGDPARAIALAEDAEERAKKQLGNGPPVAAIRARIIRARAMERHPAIAQLAEELEPLLAITVHSPADRFEIALARAEVRAARWEVMSDVEGAVVFAEVREWLEDAVGPLVESAGAAQPHQLLARQYGELAAFADRFGLPGQQRARNERERDRLRPAFDPNISELAFDIGRGLRPAAALA
jgi:tetratricopeptide (TPR) repeat protein